MYSFPTLTGRFPWERIQTRGLTGRFQTPQARRVLTGLLFTVPLLVFSALLGQSNARFGDLISDLFRWHLPA